LAEDIEVNQDLARFLLEADGHEVDIVWNGSEAVRAVQSKIYDLVLMDVQMPGMDGISATRAIRALPPPFNSVPIIAMTANVLPQQVRQFKQAGMDDHIGKPMKRADLMRKLAEWLPISQEHHSIPDKGLALHDTERAKPDFNEHSFLEFKNMMGAERVGMWLSRLEEQLQVLLSDETTVLNRQQLAKHAHALISQAALLGFSELADHCTELEQASNHGDDLTVPLEKARRSATLARATIGRKRMEITN
jgi:CheY-like chemotaxis protein